MMQNDPQVVGYWDRQADPISGIDCSHLGMQSMFDEMPIMVLNI